jgi:hypothetical protein
VVRGLCRCCDEEDVADLLVVVVVEEVVLRGRLACCCGEIEPVLGSCPDVAVDDGADDDGGGGGGGGCVRLEVVEQADDLDSFLRFEVVVAD